MDKEDEYKVGYKKPPISTRFKPGQSGNPKGRMKTPCLRPVEAFWSELNQKISVQENGKKKNITKLEAVYKRFVNEAITGRTKDLVLLLRYLPLLQKITDEQLPNAGPHSQVTILHDIPRQKPGRDQQ